MKLGKKGPTRWRGHFGGVDFNMMGFETYFPLIALEGSMVLGGSKVNKSYCIETKIA
jgi:hypothetical protein